MRTLSGRLALALICAVPGFGLSLALAQWLLTTPYLYRDGALITGATLSGLVGFWGLVSYLSVPLRREPERDAGAGQPRSRGGRSMAR